MQGYVLKRNEITEKYLDMHSCSKFLKKTLILFDNAGVCIKEMYVLYNEELLLFVIGFILKLIRVQYELRFFP